MNNCKYLLTGGKKMTAHKFGKIILSQLLCLCAAFTACTDDDIAGQSTRPLEIQVQTVTPSQSRAIITDTYLPDGSSIGVVLTAEDGTAYDGITYANLKYTASGTGDAQTWSSTSPASLSTTTGKVTAYYPYNDAEDLDLTAIPVETESQTDYMYATPMVGVNMASSKVNLTMQHALTDVRINVKKGTYTGTGAVTKVTAQAPAFATAATMNMEDGTLASVSGGDTQFAAELTDAAISTADVTHDFLVVPDASSTSGDVTLFVTIDGKKFTVTVPYTEAFQQGYTYQYNLTLDNAALTLDGVSVAKWDTKAEYDNTLAFYDDQYIVEIAVPSDAYTFTHNVSGFTGTIDWGDGTTTTYTTSTNHPTHDYATEGNYTVTAEGVLCQLICQKTSKIITKLIRIGKEMGVTRMICAFQNQVLLSEIVPGALDGCTEVTSFEGTFQYCRNLTSIPERLFDECTEVTSFYSTFSGCTSLASIPKGLFDNCTKVTTFESSFQRCRSLQFIPEGLFDNCPEVIYFGNWVYSNNGGIFEGCTSLTSIPERLFDNCTKVVSFYQSFYGCYKLQSIPEGLFDRCTEVTSFQGAFYDCGSLTEIPEGLFDSCTKVKNFSYTFYDCKSLTNIPEGLFDKCTKVMDFSYVFSAGPTVSDKMSFISIPEGLFDNCPEVTDFEYAFYGCKGLQAIPNGLFDNCTKVTDFSSAFRECTGLTAIPSGLFDNCPEVTDFEYAFYGCKGITAIPEGLFDTCLNVTNFYATFYNCSGLTAIPEGLFDKCTKVTNFHSTFSGCSALTEIPEGLFDKCKQVTDFGATFFRCSGLQSIPVGLFDKCTEVTNFYATFYNCSGLTAIPEGLFDKCTNVTSFYGTFEGCTSLTGESPYSTIQVDGVDIKVHLYERSAYPDYFTAPTSYTDCFNNCTGLTDYTTMSTSYSTWI